MKDKLLIFTFALLVLFTRVTNLTDIPIFTDEAIYIRWAQIGNSDPAQRFISLTDGKQPLFTWLMYPGLRMFSDPLIAGRMVSVFAGVFAVCGLYLLANKLFNRQTAIFAGLFYLFSPFALLYDRLALMDSLLAAFGIWSLYLSVRQIEEIRLDLSLLLGITAGFGLLTKSSALFYLLLIPFSLLLFDFKKKNRKQRFVNWAFYSLLSMIIAQIIYNMLRLSPYFYIIEQKNYTFIMPFSEFIIKPFRVFLPNLNGLIPMAISYLTIPVFITIIAGLILAAIQKNRKIMLIFLWFFLPFVALAAFGIVIFPRFILFMVIPLFLIAADILNRFFDFSREKMKPFLLIVMAVFILPVYSCYLILFNPVQAKVPVTDRNQLFDDWPSGFGVKEVVAYIDQRANANQIVLATEGTFGLNPAAYEIYLQDNSNITIKSYWPLNGIPPDLRESAEKKEVYLVTKETEGLPNEKDISLIFKVQRGLSDSYLYFYRIFPLSQSEN